MPNRGPERAGIHLLPTVWFRNTWSWARGRTSRIPGASRRAPVSNDLIHWQTRFLGISAEDAGLTLRNNRSAFVPTGIVEPPQGKVEFRKVLVARDPDGHTIQITSNDKKLKLRLKENPNENTQRILCGLTVLAGMTTFADKMKHTSNMFQRPKANTGTGTHCNSNVYTRWTRSRSRAATTRSARSRCLLMYPISGKFKCSMHGFRSYWVKPASRRR